MATIKRPTALGLRARRDELRDPLLCALTVLLIVLMFVIVPLHAAGIHLGRRLWSRHHPFAG